jgi:hypothetical protein
MPKQKEQKPVDPEIPIMTVEPTEGGSHVVYPSDQTDEVTKNVEE